MSFEMKVTQRRKGAGIGPRNAQKGRERREKSAPSESLSRFSRAFVSFVVQRLTVPVSVVALAWLLAACGGGGGGGVSASAVAGSDAEVTTTVSGDTAIVDIRSPRGIGGATVGLGKVAVKRVVLRLHLKGLENLRFQYGDTVVQGELPSHGLPEPRESVATTAASERPIGPNSPYWMKMTIVPEGNAAARIPLESGAIEVEAPAAFIESGATSFTVSWIDFYR